MGAVAQAMFQGVDDQVAFHVGNGAADKTASAAGAARDTTAGAHRVSVDFVAGRQQDRVEAQLVAGELRVAGKEGLGGVLKVEA